VTAGNLYMVGERGPEYFVPQQSGTIYPNGVAPPPSGGGRGGGGGGDTIVVNVAGSVVTERQITDAVYQGLLAKKRSNVALGLA